MKNMKKEVLLTKEIFNKIKKEYILIFRPKMAPGCFDIIDRKYPEKDRLEAASLVLSDAIRQLNETGIIESDLAGDLNYLFREYLENAGQRNNDPYFDENMIDLEYADENNF
jgi:hypothetical protein